MSTAYGRGKYGAGPYSGRTPPILPALYPIQLWVWSRTGTLKAMYQLGSSPLVSLQFLHNDTGCADCTIEFASPVDIVKSDLIKIRLGIDQWYYTGVIRRVPIAGVTTQGYTYTGLGYNDYFNRIMTGNDSFATKTISYILNYVITTYIITNTPINYNVGKLNPPAITVTSLSMPFVYIKDVFDTMLNLANSTGIEYLYGVDKDGDFYFQPRSSNVMSTLFTANTGRYGIPAYEPQDTIEELTALIVLRNDKTYYGTINSVLNNDIYMDKVNAPTMSDADLLNWATGILMDRQRTLRSASIEWPITFPDELNPIVADGYLRIMSTIPPAQQQTATYTTCGDGNCGDGICGGSDAQPYTTSDDTLAIKQVEYDISTSGATRKIELGTIPLLLEDAILKVQKKLQTVQISLGM